MASLSVRTERNSIRPDVVASLRTTGEAQRPEGADGKRPCREESRSRIKRAKQKRIWKDIGWLETERQRSSDVVNRGTPASAAERAQAVRALVRAEKRRNGRGAKGGRKVKA